MTKLTQRAATVELAIASALRDLGVTENEVEVNVISNGRKGFLGFGAKDAEVLVTVIKQPEKPLQEEKMQAVKEEVTVKEPDVKEEAAETEKLAQIDQPAPVTAEIPGREEAIEETKRYIEDLAAEMGADDIAVTYETKGKYINFQLESKKAALLIGKRGQTLNAIQQLAQLVANKATKQFKIVRIDVEDYRQRREQSLELLADRMADRAIRTRRQVALEPMPSYERKVIHNALSRRMDVETFSEGKDPYRHIVIKGLD